MFVAFFFPFFWSITGKKTCIQCTVKPHIQYLLYYRCSDTNQQEEIEHDVNTSAPKLDEWKAHILRAAHQDNAKRDIIDPLKQDQVFLIMDWAMKFLPTSFRETQRDWFGKKGKSWHVTVAVTKGDNDEKLLKFGCVVMHVILCSKEDRFLINSIILFKF